MFQFAGRSRADDNLRSGSAGFELKIIRPTDWMNQSPVFLT